ncbi:hypothetical protein OIU74_002484 [Salix koriyanagi]|uniref:Pentatricopeptide repeat-containing protein n=1 Tax=Salix koriyanagi TaxID=2511006 RepID=A0A9Q0X603_9ROSI|nr:hypothetical protein OIU74_002484 [Salix koriyanagi]
MTKYEIEPGTQHYASMVDILGRAGKLQEALSVIKGMPTEPTESVWGAFITGCRIHGNTDLAAFAADKVFELGAVSSVFRLGVEEQELHLVIEKRGDVSDSSSYQGDPLVCDDKFVFSV